MFTSIEVNATLLLCMTFAEDYFMSPVALMFAREKLPGQSQLV